MLRELIDLLYPRFCYVCELIDLLYPRFCYVCEKPIQESKNVYLCYDCWRKVPIIRENICLRCGYPLGEGVEEKKPCLICRNQRFAFASVRSAAKYKEPLRGLLLAFKYSKMTQLRFPLASLLRLMLRLKPFPTPIDAIVPVPMWYFDEMARGFNQSVLLAARLSRWMKIPCWPKALHKQKKTKRQAELHRAERQKNLASSFCVERFYHKKMEGKTILLVDDIFTTGSTANECSRVLREAGAKKVYVATVARTIGEGA